MKTLFTATFILGMVLISFAQTVPTLSSLSPANEATDVDRSADLVATFSENIKLGSGTITINYTGSTGPKFATYTIPSASEVTVSSNQLIIDPTSDMSPGDDFHVTITSGAILSTADAVYPGFSDETTWAFTTIDDVAPLITNTTPYDGSNYFFLSGGLSINFNEDIQEGSGNVILYDADGNTLETVTTGTSDSRITNYTFRTAIDFSTEIEEATVYMVSVDAGSWTDLAGNPCNAIAKGDLSFTSTSRPHIETLSPADDETDVDANTSTLSIDFDTHVWANDPAALILIDYDSEDTLETFDLTTLGDGGDFSDGLITLTLTSSLPNGAHLAVLANPVGALKSSSNGEQFLQLDDKDDWDFTVFNDDVAPTITSIPEIEGGTYDNYTLRFTINFSEPVEIDESYNMFRLGLVSPVVQYNISYAIEEVTSTSITFQVDDTGMRNGWTYYIYVDPAAVTDLAGNAFAGVTSNTEYRFQASWDEPQVLSRTPDATSNQVVDSDIIIEFDEDILLNGSYDPTVAAIRLMLRPANTNVETYTTAQIQVSGSTLTIDKTVDLDLATTYTIMVPQGLIMAAADTTRFFDGYTSIGDWQFTTEYNYWDGSQWADGTPTTGDHVIFKDDYDFAEDEVLDFGLVYVYPGVDLSIENNATLRHSSNLYNSGDITIESGASLNSQKYFVASEGSSVTVKRNTTGGVGDGKYSFIGSPFSSYDFTSISGSHKYEYKENSNVYADASNLTSMTIGQGYTIANNDVLEFVGITPTTGNLISYIRNSGEGMGFNLVSNPYTAAISYDAMMSAEGPDGTGDITSTIYLWDDGGAGEKSQSDFITVNALGSVSGGSGRSTDFNDHIGVAQGFFVECTKTSTQLNFTDAMKVNGNNEDANYFRTSRSSHETIKIALINNKDVRSEILIGLVEDAEVGYDYKYDSRKMVGNSASQLYMPLENKQLAIQGLPLDYQEAVSVGLDIKEAEEYRLEILEETLAGRSVVLYDKQLKVSHDLSRAPYQFHSQEGVFEGRFEVFFNSSILSSDLNDQVSIYAHDGWLSINVPNGEIKNYRMINVSGQEVWKGQVNHSFTKDFSNLPKGVYIVTDGLNSQKIILQ
ncbi:MAG: hypothetical protein CMB80_33450 [Flammeovirgaceae bacterium]|nr:hypothetical protein [Flammeovirgaceae bacterium]MBR07586.1 hypothetical protein [Rickettsiales bacterium]HCX25187.1 hypothetical protein [Cytophagales bacterium]